MWLGLTEESSELSELLATADCDGGNRGSGDRVERGEREPRHDRGGSPRGKHRWQEEETTGTDDGGGGDAVF